MLLELLKKSFHPSFSAFVAMAIVIVLVGSAISVAFSVHHYRLAMQELQQLREQRNAIDEWGQLLLEQHSWGACRVALSLVKSYKCKLHLCKMW